MPEPILATKLHIPPTRPGFVARPRLNERLNTSLQRKLTLLCAPAGSGKTMLTSDWVAGCGRPVAWLSLDEGDSDPRRFLAYVVAALQTIAAPVGEGVLSVLQAPERLSIESILTVLLNDLTIIPHDFVLVLDDYDLIDARAIDNALAYLLNHLPPHMHLVITSREDPQLPLARLRARGQLAELRETDLRFTPAEAAEFFNGAGVNLSADDMAALETRTEGWIVGLQLAAISMQGHEDVSGFIRSFTGSNHFVLDYLVQEVLQQQPESVQVFLLRTSILNQLCGPLCDAVLLAPSDSGRKTLEYLEHANLFLVPLDDDRRWYRYHQLFADLLRQRLPQSVAASTADPESYINALHIRASQWYEDSGLEMEAFQHAAAAHDLERAARLIEGEEMPLLFGGAVTSVLDWLESLPTSALNARPSLWVVYASALLLTGQNAAVEQRLQNAEAAMAAALHGAEPDDKTRDLVGRVAATRAMLALTQYRVEPVVAQSRRALAYLHADNLPFRSSSIWMLGYAYQLQGDRAAARQAYSDVISIGQASANTMFSTLATTGLGNIEEADNHLFSAADTYRRVLQRVGDRSLPVAACEAHLGLARIDYEWNDLDAAEQHEHQSAQLAPLSQSMDRLVACQILLARLKLARGDGTGAAALLAQAEELVHGHRIVYRTPDVVAAQVLALLTQGDLAVAAHLAQAHDLPLSQARVHLAQGDTSAALALLEAYRRQVEAKGWADERLKVMVLQAIALHAYGDKDKAGRVLRDALALAEPGGFIRIFIDEGTPMARLLSAVAAHGRQDYAGTLLNVFAAEAQRRAAHSRPPAAGSLAEPLSERELEVLRLIAQGLSNRQIGERLFLALDTVKGHNRRLFAKLGVQRRTEAVARARAVGVL